jgi:outer membrane lipoprotein-sorting protein
MPAAVQVFNMTQGTKTWSVELARAVLGSREARRLLAVACALSLALGAPATAGAAGAAGRGADSTAASASGLSAADATEIVRRADQKIRGKTGYAEFQMKVIRPDWSREVSMKSWSKGTKYSLILVTAPARDKGSTFLKRGNEVWNWVPSVEKVIKIPPSMMLQSWMGSDFTNDDLVKESSMVVDYTHRAVGDSTILDRDCWKIEMIPKPDAAVVWGKVLIWISKRDDLELRVEYYDEDGALINVMTLSDVKMLGGRMLPSRLEMVPEEVPGNKTVLVYQDAWFDRPIEDSFFSIQNMKRIR